MLEQRLHVMRYCKKLHEMKLCRRQGVWNLYLFRQQVKEEMCRVPSLLRAAQLNVLEMQVHLPTGLKPT